MVPLKQAYGSTPESEESAFAAKPVKEPENVAGFLEVVPLADKKVTYIPVSSFERCRLFMGCHHLVISLIPDLCHLFSW